MLKLESAAAFVAIAETGSITEAARRLALSKSVISERLTELERVLGAKLVSRTSRKVSMTEDGNAFYERAKRIVREMDDVASEIAERRGSLAGPLHISAPVSFGCLHLGPALYGFLAQNPKVELTLDLNDRFVNMAAGGYDAVVRHGPIDDQRVIVKRLADSKRLLVASPDYLKRCGVPNSLHDLEHHSGIIYSNRGVADWRFRTPRRPTTVRPGTGIRVNNGILMRDAAIAGLGVALLPTFFLQSALKERKLTVVNIGVEAEGATIYIAYPEHRRSSGKIRALTVWLQKTFGDPPYWDAVVSGRKR
jgi:DNA-binding transcriptional LysR family regulator